MFEIGFWELALIGVVAMIVVGPERLPGLARTAGLWLGKARRMLSDVKAEVDRELHLEEIKQSLREQADLGGVKDLGNRMKALRQDLQAEFDDPGPPPGWQPGMSSAPPPDWQPPTSDAPAEQLPLHETPSTTPPLLEKKAPKESVQLEKPDTSLKSPQSPAAN
ncbi:MAG: twin-arginine translocase subunit TatB [Gammaproteobacteria bacterium]|nr:twin-arginine translocase subunit TatB [Gammaproteobacteria bacterium]